MDNQEGGCRVFTSACTQCRKAKVRCVGGEPCKRCQRCDYICKREAPRKRGRKRKTKNLISRPHSKCVPPAVEPLKKELVEKVVSSEVESPLDVVELPPPLEQASLSPFIKPPPKAPTPLNALSPSTSMCFESILAPMSVDLLSISNSIDRVTAQLPAEQFSLSQPQQERKTVACLLFSNILGFFKVWHPSVQTTSDTERFSYFCSYAIHLASDYVDCFSEEDSLTSVCESLRVAFTPFCSQSPMVGNRQTRLSTEYENIGDGVLIVRLQPRPFADSCWVNRSICDSLGYDVNALRNNLKSPWLFYNFLHAHDRALYFSEFWSCIRRGHTVYNSNLKLRHAQGYFVKFACVHQIVYDEAQTMPQLHIVCAREER